jgi:Xaa-Pro dipeptidase
MSINHVSLGRAHYQARLAQLQQAIEADGLDGLLLLDAGNLMWACGFFHIPNERPIGYYIPRRGDPTFYVPLLEKEQAEAADVGNVRHYWEYPGHIPAEVWMLNQIGPGAIGVDAAGYEIFLKMQAANSEVRISHIAARMRYLKTPGEIALTEMAARYADHGLGVARRLVAEGLRDGITEIDVVRGVQAETTEKMKRELSELTNFYRGAITLTAHTGARGALPHGQPGPNRIMPGDTLIVGIGAKVGGYHAESGCTFIVGDATPDQLRCLETTWACDEAAVAALKPGATCTSVDEAALRVLFDAGYGPYIRHRIGHGMGLVGHEAPWLSEGDQTILQPTMIFSNEPGIYRPGIDGYRIIDTMLVTEQGGRRLSRYLSEHGPDDRVIA